VLSVWYVNTRQFRRCRAFRRKSNGCVRRPESWSMQPSSHHFADQQCALIARCLHADNAANPPSAVPLNVLPERGHGGFVPDSKFNQHQASSQKKLKQTLFERAPNGEQDSSRGYLVDDKRDAIPLSLNRHQRLHPVSIARTPLACLCPPRDTLATSLTQLSTAVPLTSPPPSDFF
jgi:hypothetical protein